MSDLKGRIDFYAFLETIDRLLVFLLLLEDEAKGIVDSSIGFGEGFRESC